MVTVSFENMEPLRRLKRFSRRALAQESGVSESHIAGIERGRKQPTVEVICKLACAMGVRPEELFEYNCR